MNHSMYPVISSIYTLAVCLCLYLASTPEYFVYDLQLRVCKDARSPNISFRVFNKKNSSNYRQFQSNWSSLRVDQTAYWFPQTDTGGHNKSDICTRHACDLEIRAFSGTEENRPIKLCWKLVILKNKTKDHYRRDVHIYQHWYKASYAFYVPLEAKCDVNIFAKTTEGEDRPRCVAREQCLTRGNYGKDCNETCVWCINHDCDRYGDGVCKGHVCNDDLMTGLRCEIKCQAGHWGMELDSDGKVVRTCHNRCYCRYKQACGGNSGECIYDECELGYKSGCQEICEPRKWGRYCDKDCRCLHGDNCYHDGKCPRGYEKDCGPGMKYGPYCDKKCHCANNEPCDNQTGHCRNGCDVRYFGNDCQTTCPENKYRYRSNPSKYTTCSMTCHCIDAECNALNGTCVNGCSREPIQYWGPRCQKNCSCHGGADCNPTNGSCPRRICDMRHYGPSCHQTCPKDRYLKNQKCDGICRCKIENNCRVTTGLCATGGCIKGWLGSKCDSRCKFGVNENCENICHFKEGENCSRNDGSCPGGCQSRYYGEGCAKTCDRDRFFKDGACSGTCRCLNNVKCNAANGECASGGCIRGWTGTDCQTPCDKNKREFGKNCDQRCHCANNDSCDPINGHCNTCHHRYYGDSCQGTCPLGNFRKDCTGECHCKDNNNCAVLDGKCTDGCAAGWIGNNCQKNCNQNTWGENCKRYCHCNKNEQCDHKTGKCDSGCHIRYTGEDCQSECNETMYMNEYGNCTENCKCKQDSKCRVKDGLCTDGLCRSGTNLTDFRCLPQCDRGKYRLKREKDDECKHTCHCSGGEQCDVIDGRCPSKCNVRYMGTSCNKTCPDSSFKDIFDNCTGKCHCVNNTLCRVMDGSCADGRCAAGYKGWFCNETCENKMYGPNCLKCCQCSNNSKCDRATGSCGEKGCNVRYYGTLCDKTCKENAYLVDGECSGRCLCMEPDECNVVNGNCGISGCLSGRKGEKCNRRCLKRFGEKCEKRCNCYNDEHCDTETGECVNGCDYRYTGSDCQISCPTGKFLDAANECTKRCNCYKDANCNVIDGVCPGSKCLSVRYRGYNCQENCTLNVYLIDNICSGECHCADPNQCDVSTGSCGGSECAPGWLGERCNIACNDGTFGPNCTRECHCKFNRPCAKTYGSCGDEGCAEGFTGSNCQQKAEYTKLVENAGAYTGVFVGFGLLAICLGFIHQRRKMRQRNTVRKIILSRNPSLHSRSFQSIGYQSKTIDIESETHNPPVATYKSSMDQHDPSIVDTKLCDDITPDHLQDNTAGTLAVPNTDRHKRVRKSRSRSSSRSQSRKSSKTSLANCDVSSASTNSTVCQGMSGVVDRKSENIPAVGEN